MVTRLIFLFKQRSRCILGARCSMTRHLNKREIKKRLAIRADKARDAGLTTRVLARKWHTSLRVVCDALARRASEWQELLEERRWDAMRRGMMPQSRGLKIEHEHLMEEDEQVMRDDDDAALNANFDPPDDFVC